MESYNMSLDPGINCVPEPSPYVMIWPSGKSLEISEELVVIRDELGVERFVDMKVDSHAGAVTPIKDTRSVGGKTAFLWSIQLTSRITDEDLRLAGWRRGNESISLNVLS